MKCLNCGNVVNDNLGYCTKCGNIVNYDKTVSGKKEKVDELVKRVRRKSKMASFKNIVEFFLIILFLGLIYFIVLG